MQRFLRIATPALVGLSLLVAASAPGPVGSSLLAMDAAAPNLAAEPSTAAVDIVFFGYSPLSITVPVGTTITWSNRDAIEHSVTEGASPNPGGAFDSGLFPEDGAYSFTFDRAGVFQYFCRRHPFMQGEITVISE